MDCVRALDHEELKDGFCYALLRTKVGYDVACYGFLEGVSKLLHRVWCLDDQVKRHNQLAICRQTIYVPIRSSNVIKRYSIRGEPLGNDIPVNMAESNTFICDTPAGNLVLSQTNPALLVCVDPQTRKTLWIKRDLLCPQVVVAYDIQWLLVYTENLLEKAAYLDVRNLNTGNLRVAFSNIRLFSNALVYCIKMF